MFDLPEEALTAGDPLHGESQAVKLPFPTPEIYWYNGKPGLAETDEIKDARRFGGWGIDAETFAKSYHLSEAPIGFKLFENLRSGEGKTFSAFLSRSVLVAPIARRWRFLEIKNSDGTYKFRGSQVNFLVYLAQRTTEGEMIPWGPAVLSGKRYSGNHIDAAFAKFADDTKELRGDTAARWFYAPLGTFGPTPIFEKKTGKEGKSSEITPCQVGKPKNGFDTPTIESLFVGKEVAAVILDLGQKAQDWVHDWDKKVSAEPDFLS